MKVKILLIKHFDHALLAVLGLLLLFAVYKVFLVSDPTVKKIDEDIQKFEVIINRELQSKQAPEPQVPRYAKDLEDRFRHAPVISPFTRNPFFPEVITVDRLILGEGAEFSKRFNKTELREPTVETDIIALELSYDEHSSVSSVTVEGLMPGSIELQLTDTQDRTYRWLIIVKGKREMWPPRPAVDVVIKAYAPQPADAASGEPARVLITCRADNPDIAANERVGFTTHIRVYRKLADAPPVEYLPLSDALLAPATAAEIEAIWQRVQTGRQPTLITPGPGHGPRPMPNIGGSFVPPVTELTGGHGPDARPKDVTSGKPQPGDFVFLDDTVDPGESYTYRIVTFSTVEGQDPLPTKTPYETRIPVAIPSLYVIYWSGGNRIVVRWPSAKAAGKIGEDKFTLFPGMVIHSMAKVQIIDPVTKLLITVPEEVSINRIVVDTLSSFPGIEVRARYRPRERAWSYQTRLSSESVLLYLTPRLSLRWKEREKPVRTRTP